ncbi:MAG: hypothetical protein WCS70_12835 [Verrucomicrobiota bacterium]
MTEKPQWIVARLGEDFNWWLEDTSPDAPPSTSNHSVLDPRQLTHLVQLLEEYRPHGLRREQMEAAFTLFTLDAETEEGCVRLSLAESEKLGDGGELFALPAIDADGDGSYFDFLDAVIAARVRKLNATHGTVVDCTADEMTTELEAIDAGRYFSDDSRHCFDEINEILVWEPAGWDDPSES